MPVDPEELEKRLRNDENMWVKVQENANRQHMDSLNQLADLFRLFTRMSERIDKQGKIIKRLEEKLDAIHPTD